MTVFLMVTGALLLLLLWALYEAHQHQINHHSVEVGKKLSRPLKILHLSDIHFHKKSKKISCFFEQLSALEYDLILVTGDVIDCESGIPIMVENFKKLKAKHGFFAVLGNHDYYDYHFLDIFLMTSRNFKAMPKVNSLRKIREAFETLNITLLRNQAHFFEREGFPISIYGIDDPTTGRMNLKKTVTSHRKEALNLFLSHSIDAVTHLEDQVADLIFSGHSHGGQVRLPGLGAIVTHTQMGRAYADGIKKYKETICCISKGVASSRYLPIRFLCRPEAVVLTVRNSA